MIPEACSAWTPEQIWPKTSSACRLVILQPVELAQERPLRQGHHEVGRAVLQVREDDRHHVRMPDPLHDPDLALEPLQLRPRQVAVLQRQRLPVDDPLHLQDRPHPPPPDQAPHHEPPVEHVPRLLHPRQRRLHPLPVHASVTSVVDPVLMAPPRLHPAEDGPIEPEYTSHLCTFVQ